MWMLISWGEGGWWVRLFSNDLAGRTSVWKAFLRGSWADLGLV